VNNLREAATLKEELLKLVVLNYIKCCTKIKKNRCGLYASEKKIIDHRSICDDRVALTKTCLHRVDLSLASFVKGLKEKPLKNLTEHTDNHNQTKIINITSFSKIFA
jgi:hypothetical protein